MSAKTYRPRRLRHWKQQYDENASFVWRRPIQWKGKLMKPGAKLSKKTVEDMGRNKLRRLWESHKIELCDFSTPTVAPDMAIADLLANQPPEVHEEVTSEEPEKDSEEDASEEATAAPEGEEEEVSGEPADAEAEESDEE